MDKLSGVAADPYQVKRGNAERTAERMRENILEALEIAKKDPALRAVGNEQLLDVDRALKTAIDNINTDEAADKFNIMFNDVLKKARLGSREAAQPSMDEFMVGLMGSVFDKTKGGLKGFDEPLTAKLDALQKASADRMDEVTRLNIAHMKATGAGGLTEEQGNKLRAARLTEQKTLRGELTEAVQEYIDTWLRARGIEEREGKKQIENLDAMIRGFGSLASAASYATRYASEGFHKMTWQAHKAVSALQSASEAIKQYKAIEKGAGIMANTGSVLGTVAAVAMPGMQMYQAVKGPSGEEQAAREARRRNRDFGATVNRGPQTINYNPTLVVQADGSVYFAYDSMEIVVDEQRRLLQETQEFGMLGVRGEN